MRLSEHLKEKSKGFHTGNGWASQLTRDAASSLTAANVGDYQPHTTLSSASHVTATNRNQDGSHEPAQGPPAPLQLQDKAICINGSPEEG